MSKKELKKLIKSDWMTTIETAEYLRFFTSKGTPDTFRVRNLVHDGRIPFHKPFGRLLFCRKELDALIRKSRDGGWKCQ